MIIKDKQTKNYIKYIFQSVSSTIGISIYIIADTYFISVHSGSDGLAVLNLVIPMLCLIYAIGAMVGIGSATRYKIEKSSGKNTDYNFMEAIIWSLIISAPFVILAICFPKEILGLLGADSNLIAIGYRYLQVIMLTSPFFMMNYSFLAFVRNDGNPVTAMLGSLSGCAFNIIFDYVFMFMMNMGLEGAALATSGCPILSMLICLTHYLSKRNTVSFKYKGIKFNHLVKSCKLGIPALVSELSTSITTVVFNLLILAISGNTGVAAFAIVCNISCIVIAIFNGMAEGSQPMLSESFGKKDYVSLKKLLSIGIKIVIIGEIVMVGICILFPNNIIAVFNSENNEKLKDLARDGMILYFLGYVFAGFNIFVLNFFAAISKAKESSIGSSLRGVILITILPILLSKLFGMNGIWISFAAAELITFVYVIINLKATLRELKV